MVIPNLVHQALKTSTMQSLLIDAFVQHQELRDLHRHSTCHPNFDAQASRSREQMKYRDTRHRRSCTRHYATRGRRSWSPFALHIQLHGEHQLGAIRQAHPLP